MSKKSLYANLAAFAAFCSGVPGFGGSGKYQNDTYERLELGKGMSSEEMGTKGKKKLPKSKRNKCCKTKSKSQRNKTLCSLSKCRRKHK